MYTTIIHPIRKALHLSLIDYIVLEEIRSLSNSSNKFGGWCIKSKAKMAQTLDVGDRTVFRSIETLIERGLVEKAENGYLRCTNEWLEIIADKDNWSIANRKIASFNPETVKKNKCIGSAKMAEGVCQNGRIDSAKMADKYNIENNNKNLIKIKDFWNGEDEEKTLVCRRVQKNPSCKVGKRIMMECKKITPSIEKTYKKLKKDYTFEDFKHGITQYAIDIVNRQDDRSEKDYCSHRFSLNDFLSQKNAFIKFLNYSKEL